jgi:hypothetical protein
MDSQKVKVTLVSSKYFGRYGVIQKVTPKKFKIRFWDTGEETYLWQTSVAVLPTQDSNHSQQNFRTDDTTFIKKKKAKAKVRGVNHAVSQLLESLEEDGGVTKSDWEGIVDKIGKMFI